LNFPVYIAKRYLVSRKSHNVINIISGVSVAGVTVGTMALIIVLSVFNGFQELVTSLFNSFNPDLEITAIHGKTFSPDSLTLSRLRSIPGVKNLSEVIQENALMRYKDKQYIVTLKGVDPNYKEMSRLDTMMTEGEFLLQSGDHDFTVLGYGVAYYLDARLNDVVTPIEVYIPSRTADLGTGLDQGFRQEVIFPSGFFSIQQDFDIKYSLVPIRFMKKLLGYDSQVSSLEIRFNSGSENDRIRERVQAIMGDNFSVKDRFQQEEMIYKIMKSEKWAIFLILSFILLIATFNVIGSLSMLILDKRKDIAVLKSLGASNILIRRIFLTEGMMISFAGALAGMALGAVICYIQQRFGIIKLGAPDSTFVVDAYPVSIRALDFLLVFITVSIISFAAAWYPVYNIRKMDTSLVRVD
jgi:lipoprotein-releasing system permease protein